MVSGLVLVGVLGAYSHQVEHRAERIFRISYEFSTRDAPTLDDLRHQFGADLKQPDPCTPWGCKYEVTLTNRVLATIHLSLPTALSSSFWVKDSTVQENVVELWTVNRVAYVDAKYCNECDGFDVSPCEGPIASFGSGSARIGSRSTRKEKRAAFAFNSSCLTAFRGCTTIAELAPQLWHGSVSGATQCTDADRQ
jgi:hypothetical protein